MAPVIPASTVEAAPYVGPRPFGPDEWQKFFGRDTEARELQARIISERFTLFYAQMGAGKSSLINTRIIRGLCDEGFEVLPVARVSGHDGAEVAADNIYVYNLLASLHQQKTPPPGLSTMSIAHFLDNLVDHDGEFYYDDAYEWPPDAELKPRVLIIDQFEEIITTNSAYWAQREPFFRQLGEALKRDDLLWVVLAMREDFVANLDPYLHLVNDGIRQRFYMQQLDRDAALMAIKLPVANIRPFEDGAAETLRDNLLATGRRGDDGRPLLAEFVEPVQLQAVCLQMWQKLRERPGPTITRRDVVEFADVDKALLSFYEDTLAETVAETGVSEAELRRWFGTELITEAGTRNMVFRGPDRAGELPIAAAAHLKSRSIIREVVRPGGVFYELVHDRFIKLIIEANREWLQDQPLLQLAQQWERNDFSDTHLLTAKQLAEYGATNWQALGDPVPAFMEASREGKRKRTQRLTAALAAAALVVVIGLIVVLIVLNNQNTELQAANADITTRAAVEADLRRAQDLLIDELGNQNRLLTEKERELAETITTLDTTVAELRALQLVDLASDYLNQGRLDGAILMSYRAMLESPGPPPLKVRAVLFDALNRKIERRNLASSLRGRVPVPLEGASELVADIIPGPYDDTLAAVVNGDVYWWRVEPGETPVAQQLTPDVEASQPISLTHAAFATGHNVLALAGQAIVVRPLSTTEPTPAPSDAGGGAAESPTLLQLWRPGGDAPTPLQSFSFTDRITALTFSADGRRLAAALECVTAARSPTCRRLAVWNIDPTVPENLADEEPRLIPVDSDSPVTGLVFADQDEGTLVWTNATAVAFIDLDDPSGRNVFLPRLTDLPIGVNDLVALPGDDLLLVSGCDSPMDFQEWLKCSPFDPAWLEWWDVSAENPVGHRAREGYVDFLVPLSGRGRVVLARRGDDSWPFRSVSLPSARSDACRVAGRNPTADEWLAANESLVEYEPYCPGNPDVSVITRVLADCASPMANDVQACRELLGGWFGPTMNVELLSRVNGLIVDAREDLQRHQRTTILRRFVEAGRLLVDLPGNLAAAFAAEMAPIYNGVCLGRNQSDSPAALEACDYVTELPVTGSYRLVEAEAGRNLWRLTGPADEPVLVVVEALEQDTPIVSLYDAQMGFLNSVEGAGSDRAQIDGRLTDGTLFVEVSWLGSPRPYSLSVIAPQPLTAGRVTGLGDSDRLWRFDGRGGEFAALEVVAPGYFPLLRLRNVESGFAVPEDGSSLGSQINLIVPDDAPYTLEIDWDGEVPPSYELVAEFLSSEVLPFDQPITVDDPERRVWRFEGEAGDAVTVAIDTIDADPILTLYGPSGEVVAFNDDYVDQDSRIALSLRTNGTHTVVVDWSGIPNAADPFTLSALRLPGVLRLDETREASAEQTFWRLEAGAGGLAVLSVEASEPGVDPRMALLDGETELATSDNADGLNPRIVHLLAPGHTYFIRVDSPGAYTVAVSSFAPQPLTLGQTLSGIPPDRSVWQFEAQAGDSLTAAVVGPEDGNPWLELRDAEFNLLTSNDNHDGNNPQLEYPLFNDGPYLLVVGWFGGEGPYTLTSAVARPEELVIGGPVQEAAPDRRFWRFSGAEGDRVAIAVDVATGDPTLRLRDGEFRELDGGFADDTEGLEPRLTFTLPDDGAYVIEVGWFSAPQPYFLTLEHAPTADSGTSSGTAPNPVETTATPLTGSVARAAADRTLWQFRGVPGEVVSIDLRSLEDGDATLTLVDAPGASARQLAYSDDFDGRDPKIVHVLPDEGPFFLRVGWYGEPTPYALTFSRYAPSALPLDEEAPAGRTSQTVWSFDGAEGDVISATLTTRAFGDPTLSLYNADGDELAFSDDFSDLNPHVIYRLPEDGIYTLRIGWQDWTDVFGPYGLRAEVIEPAALAPDEPPPDATDRRLWRFTGRAGQTITLAAEASGDEGNLWLQLLNDRFERVAFSDNADGLNPRLTVTLPESGTYYLEVGWFGPPGASYRLSTEE